MYSKNPHLPNGSAGPEPEDELQSSCGHYNAVDAGGAVFVTVSLGGPPAPPDPDRDWALIVGWAVYDRQTSAWWKELNARLASQGPDRQSLARIALRRIYGSSSPESLEQFSRRYVPVALTELPPEPVIRRTRWREQDMWGASLALPGPLDESEARAEALRLSLADRVMGS